MRKKIIGIIAIIIIVAVIFGGYTAFKRITTPKKVHYHAGFVVYENGKKLDFSDFKYMRVKPCTDEKNKHETAEDIQQEKAHLHDNVGDVVHIERANAKWADLFHNLKYSVNYKSAAVYLNGRRVDSFSNMLIGNDDVLVIFIGSDENMQQHLVTAPTKKYIEEKAKKSVDCD